MISTPAASRAGLPGRLRLMVALLGVAILMLLALLLYQEWAIREDIYDRIVSEKLDAARQSVQGFFSPLNAVLDVVGEWAAAGELDLDQPDRLARRLGPLLAPIEPLEELLLVPAEGGAFLVRTGEDGWQASVAPDPRQEQWYRDVLAHGAAREMLLARTRASHPDSTGLIAARAWLDSLGNPLGAAAMRIRSGTADRLAGELAVSEHSFVLFPAREGNLSWTSPVSGPGFHSTDYAELLASAQADASLITAALLEWNRRGRVTGRSFRFGHDGSVWWAGFTELETTTVVREIGVLLPRADLAARLRTVTTPVTYVLLALVAILALMLGNVALRYRRQLRALRHKGHLRDDIEELRRLIAEGEGDDLEFKSTLRWNLHTKKPGREIELAWLKTVVAFLNGTGGTLLIGVQDDGAIVGIESDGFRNDDKFLLHVDNCIHRHVGVEFGRYIEFGLREIDGRKVLIIDCRRAEEAAFLRHDEDEDFYVRIGASSRKLPTAKAIEYVSER